FFFKQKTAYEFFMTGVQTCALPIWTRAHPRPPVGVAAARAGTARAGDRERFRAGSVDRARRVRRARARQAPAAPVRRLPRVDAEIGGASCRGTVRIEQGGVVDTGRH